MQVEANGRLVLTPTPGDYGTIHLILHAQDIYGGYATDCFEVHLLPRIARVNAATIAPVDQRNGATWDSAFRTLRKALDYSVSGQEIWVAAGVYYPDEDGEVDSNSRDDAFEVPTGVSVYGGFSGAEQSRQERDIRGNV